MKKNIMQFSAFHTQHKTNFVKLFGAFSVNKNTIFFHCSAAICIKRRKSSGSCLMSRRVLALNCENPVNFFFPLPLVFGESALVG